MSASKLALGVPPAVTLLLASRGALAKSSSGNNGWGQEKRGQYDGTNNGSDNPTGSDVADSKLNGPR